MRFYVLVLLTGTLSACVSTRPEAGLPPYYAAAPVPAPGTQGADPAVSTTGDALLDAYLRIIAVALERHDWRGLAYTLDEEAYAEQFAFMRESGRSAEAAVAQVLEETFGLGTVGNEVYPPVLDRDERPFAGLDRLRAVTLESAEAAGEGKWQVEGRVRLDDRTSRRLSFTVTRIGDAYRVVVPQG